MKKNYFSAFKKSAGFFPVIILGLFLAAAAYASYNDTIFTYVKGSDSVIGIVIKRLAPALFLAFSVVGLVGLRSKKVNLIDTFRFSNVLGVLLALGGLYITKNMPTLNSIILLSCAGGVSLLEIFVRMAGKKEVTDRMGFNGYMGAVANSFNPICSGIIALGILAAFIFLRDYTQVQEYIFLYGTLASLIAVFASLVISINKSSYANFIDVLLFIAFEAITLIMLYSLIDSKQMIENLLIIFGSLSVALLLRGFTFTGDYKSSKLKANRYFAHVFSSHSVLLPLIVGAGISGLFIYSTYLKNDLFYLLHAINIYKNPLNTDLATMIFSIALMAICVLNILLIIILRNLKSPEIEKVDMVVSINSHIVLYGLPILYFAFKDVSNFQSNLIPFIAAIVFAVFALFAIIIQLIRLKNYQGIMIEDIILQSQEAKAEEEKTAEEATEEPVEEPAQEPEEAAEPAEEATEEVTEQPAEEPEVEVEEQVIYVDEDGNEIEAPVDGEEVEEEVIYVDEDGNEISKEEALALEAEAEESEPTEEVVEETVEEPTEEVVEEIVEEPTEEVVEEVVEEPVEEVQEVVVEEPQEEIEEAEDDEEDSEDETEEEFEEVEEAEADEEEEQAPEKKSNVLVNDFEVLDSEGKPKKIRTKFNSKLMYALPETKDYYSEIKNYLVMYRCKGRYSSRCETFRYKGLVAKVALGGKAVKVFLAIDPTSLEGSKYHYRDMSEKKQYVEVPTMIKVRSPRGLKYFKELVDLLMAARAVKPKRGFEPTDYTADLVPNGEAILGKLGLSRDVLGKPMTVSSLPDGIPDNIEDYIPAIQGEPLEEPEQPATVYLDTLCSHFMEGEEVTIDVLKSLHVVTAGNVIHVKARGAMDRSLKIYAEYFDADALKVLMATNSTAVKVLHDVEEFEEVTE